MLKRRRSRKDTVEGIYAKNLLEDLTSETHNSELWINGSSARAISQRVGLGRMSETSWKNRQSG